MKHVFHKASDRLTEENRWYLKRYLDMSEELKKAYELKEAYRAWFVQAKETGLEDIAEVKEGLHRFYRLVQVARIPEMTKAISTLQNWRNRNPKQLRLWLFEWIFRGYETIQPRFLNEMPTVIEILSVFGRRFY